MAGSVGVRPLNVTTAGKCKPAMHEVILDCAYADGASGDAPDLETRAAAIYLIIESVRRIAGLQQISSFQYLENDDPTYWFSRRLRVTGETPEEIDALWLSNVRLEVRESDRDLFIARAAVAIRPGCHRGTILLDAVRIELAFDPCRTSALAWSLPDGIELDPDEHAAVIQSVIDEHGLRARFAYNK